ncbi:MAG TPA: hypothetical protein VNY05_02625 [Candidatus Acidoferrales bacterium]|nr:hypothetical protein [Candidatus Acidoferrales bacterium]
MSKSKPITLGAAIFYGGLIAGTLDEVDIVVAYYFAVPGALVGLLAHFSIAFAVAAIYVGATRFLHMLSREAVMLGTIYGAAVFIVMNFVVLPHTAVVKSPLSLPLLLNGILGHALFVGLPIALAARRITNQFSFSTQAAY